MPFYRRCRAGAFALALAFCWLGIALPAEASLARRLGQPISAYSASLFGKTNLSSIQLQTLTADPDEPLAGSTSTDYDPVLVTVIGFGRGPGYIVNPGSPFSSGAGVEVIDAGSPNGKALIDLETFLGLSLKPAETGYLRFYFQISGEGPASTGKLTDDFQWSNDHADFDFLGTNGPVGVDTHFYEFMYKEPNDTTPASYRVYAEEADKHYTLGDGPTYTLLNSDFVVTQDDPENEQRPGGPVPFEAATVVGTVPEPAGLCVLAAFALALRRRRD
jgi:hypothetical protein